MGNSTLDQIRWQAGNKKPPYSHCKVSQTTQRPQSKDFFHLLNGFCVFGLNQMVNLVDDFVDPGDAILRAVFLDGVVPFRVPVYGVDYTRGRDATPQDMAVLDDGKCGLGPCETPTVQDPRGAGGGEVASSRDVRERGALSKIRIVGDGLFVGQEPQVVGARVLKGITLAVVPVLQNHPQTAGGVHEDLYDTGLEVAEPRLSVDLASDVQKHRTPRLVVRRVEPVPLGEGRVGVGFVAGRVWEVVDQLGEIVRRVVCRSTIFTQRSDLSCGEASKGCRRDRGEDAGQTHDCFWTVRQDQSVFLQRRLKTDSSKFNNKEVTFRFCLVLYGESQKR